MTWKTRFYDRFLAARVRRWFFKDLIRQTNNFGQLTWLGYPIWQNILDLWTIQEVIAAVKPALIIETGTNRGGSSRYYGHLFDLMGAKGRILTIDVQKLHELAEPRVTYLIGSSTSEEILARVRAEAQAACGPVLVILDSDHSEDHVRRELEHYAHFATVGSYCLVQDGVIDTLTSEGPDYRGPLPAIESYLQTTDDFVVDEAKCQRFVITHHPKGWLRRVK